MNNSPVVRTTAAMLCLFATSLTAHAVVTNHFDEPGMYPGRDYVHQSFAEHIDPFNGNLELQYVDVFLPGNGGFDLKVQRSYNSNRANDQYSPFGRGWDIHFGRVQHDSGMTVTCASAVAQSMSIVLPDGSLQPLYKSNGSLQGTGTTTSDYVTTQLWKAQCVAGGITVFAPNGTRYDMTEADTNAWLVKRITDRNGNSADFTYVTVQRPSIPASARKAIATVSTSDGRSVTFTYSNGHLASVSTFGRTWYYNIDGGFPDGSYRLLSVQPPADNAWQYGYFGSQSAAGSYALQTVTYPQGGNISFAYQFVSFLLQDPSRKWTVVSSKTNADGTWSFNYNPQATQNDITTVTLPGSLGSITYYHFGHGAVSSGSAWKIGLLNQKVTQGAGQSQTETLLWTPLTQPISNEPLLRDGYTKTDSAIYRPLLQSREIIRDGQRSTTTYPYFDAYGNATTVSESGNKSRTNNRSFFNSSTAWIIGFVQDENISGARVISRNYYPNGNLNTETIDNVQTSFGYNTDGSLQYRRDALGNTINYSNYFRGIARTETRPESVVISRVVDNFGNVTSESDGEFSWDYDYDNLNRIKLVDPPGSTSNSTTIVWSSTSRALTRGSFQESLFFDAYGRLDHSTRSLIPGNYKTYQYDALGRKKFESFPGISQGSVIQYDHVGRQKSVATPHGTRSWDYSSGNVTVSDERGKQTTYGYDRYGDPDDRYLVSVTAPEPDLSISMNRDAVGRLNTAAQGGVTRSYGYQNGYLTTVTDPETGITRLDRDLLGNLRFQTVGSSSTNQFEYDGLSRMWRATYGGPAGTVTYTFDRRGKVKTITSSATSAALREYDYWETGNLKTDKLTIDGLPPFSVSYVYDGNDALSWIAYPMSKGTVTYTPDALGRPTKVTPYLTNVSHYPSSGNLLSLTYGNGVVLGLGQEPDRQLPTSVASSAIQLNLSYTYDPVGNVDYIADPNGGDRNPEYDGANRLKSISGPWGTGTVGYGQAGNINLQQFGTYQINYVYDTSNKLVSLNGSRSMAFGYDTRGNITTNGTSTFSFDNASRLICANCLSSNPVNYRYDGQGIRVAENKGGIDTYFVQAPNGDLQFEYSPYGKRWTVHAYLHGKRVASESGSDALSSSVSASASPNPYPQSTLLSASVSPASVTGTIEFLEGATSLGVVSVVAGSGSISPNFSAGTHSIVVNYSGDANYQPSSTTLSVIVAKQDVTATISGAPANAVLGQSVTLASNVSGTNTTGQVQFRDGSQILGTVALTSGSASITMQLVTSGNHSFTSVYLGDANHNTATSSAASTMVPAGTPAIAVVSAAPSINSGRPVTFTASVSGVAGVPPSGTVGFVDGVSPIAGCTSIPVSSGSIVCSSPPLSPGNHLITAQYSGDSAYDAASSAPITQAVWDSPLTPTNVALASNGGVATASSTLAPYPVAAVNNGERTGANITSNAWVDNTRDEFPDWVQIDFSGAQTIDHVVVYSVQDNYTSPVEPGNTLTFANYGIVDFDVQGWDGTTWVTLGSVTGNNLVKRTVSFPAFTTSRIRVNITNALYVSSRVVEIEAWSVVHASSTNVALAGNGGVASASTTSSIYTVTAINNGERTGANLNVNAWVDDTPSAFPDWVQIDFGGSNNIDRVVVYSVQDNAGNPIEPSDSLTFANYGIVDFDVQGWNGAGWVTLASVAGNNLVKRTVSFPAFATSRIRVVVNNALYISSRIVEVEAWTAPVALINVAASGNGGVVTASSTNVNYTLSAVNNGERTGVNLVTNCWVDDTPSAFPDWVQIDFGASQTIDHVVVFSVQDNYASPIEPSDTLTFANYGLVDFEVQGWDGTSWVSLGSAVGNNLVKRTVSFPAYTTSRIRVNITNALYISSRVVEIEAWKVAP